MLYPICDLGLHHLATPIVPLCWPSPPPQFFADAGRAGGRNYPLAQKDDAERALPPSSTSARNRSSTRPRVGNGKSPRRISAMSRPRARTALTAASISAISGGDRWYAPSASRPRVSAPIQANGISFVSRPLRSSLRRLTNSSRSIPDREACKVDAFRMAIEPSLPGGA